jgi:rubrerythrin
MKSLKGTQTEKFLLAAFAGESQARNRYTYFASAAKKEGYEQISAIFLETAENEKEHAKLFFKLLEGGEAEITATYPAGVIGATKDNLGAAADGERLEHTKLYPDSADVADKEGFPEVARTFRNVSMVEIQHEMRYRKLIENIVRSQVFKRENKVRWICRNCGHVMDVREAPEKCPVCQHPKAYFELMSENY